MRLSQKNKKTYNYYLMLDDPNSLDNKVLDQKVRREMVRSLAYNFSEAEEDGDEVVLSRTASERDAPRERGFDHLYHGSGLVQIQGSRYPPYVIVGKDWRI